MPPPPGFPPQPAQHLLLAQQLAIQPPATVAASLAGPTCTADQTTTLPHAFSAINPASGAWNIDIGASSRLYNSINSLNSLSEIFNTCMYLSISVGDGHFIPVTNTGHSILPTPFKSFHLNNVLITPHIVKNLIYVRQFVRDNNCTIEFDAFGFSVKDFMTRQVLLRCDSTGDLYSVTAPSLIPHVFLVSQHTWHQRLGHLGREVLRHLVSNNFISCNKEKPHVLCHACQHGKHVRLLFVSSNTVVTSCFKIIHSDVWTSPIPVKYLADGMLSRYKARLVANGSTQLERVDVDETFSLVVKPGTIWTVLSLVASRHWPIHQLDVKNAFLHGDLSETVYMHQPPRFWDTVHPDYETNTAYLLLYVDDIVLIASSERLLQQVIYSLHKEFAMTDLGPLNYFLGISVTRNSSGMFLSQKKSDIEILDRAYMVNCNPSRTPIDTESKLGSGGDSVSDPTLYRSLTGSLQYLTFTRSDISYAVHHVCLYMHDLREPHFSAFKRILRYIHGTLDYGLQLFSSSTRDLVAYSDVDWAGCPTTRRSTSGYCVFLGNNLLPWSSKRQPTLSHSSAEAEYRGVANAIAETCYAVYLSYNLIQHQRTKHIEIDIHFVRDLVAAGQCVCDPDWYQEGARLLEEPVVSIGLVITSMAPVGRVILFGTIPTTIPDTTPVITPPTTQTDTTVIPTETPIIAPTIPPSPDYTPASLNYSPTSEIEPDLFEDPPSDHIPPLPAVAPFLSSADDTTNSDTPNTPPSPTHALGQPIPHGRPYRYHLNRPVHMMTVRKRVGPLPIQQLAVRHHVDHSLSDYFFPDDSAQDSSSDSSSEASSDFHSVASSDSSSRYSLSDHSSPDLPSTSAGPSHKRCRSYMTSVLALPLVSGALSLDCADLVPSPKRVRDSGYLADVEVDPRETSLILSRDTL
ncbi:ribonuclease H-like domain-containing protein [Tanacetum coccineum]